ncbi:unnamed protein product [Adineta steineri]|uniref:Zinc-binding loop region of homing endonuclease domain-containing protein n=1 Tax=Adineta steineri TaxID=433720 RepID=A0A814WBY4_9BILA|nr:unnamed protein product [Adineta steineri]
MLKRARSPSPPSDDDSKTSEPSTISKRPHTTSSDDDFEPTKSSTIPKKIIKSTTTKPPVTPSPSSAASSDVLSDGIRFLNFLENDEADGFCHDIILDSNALELIKKKNCEGWRRRDLAKLKGFNGRDGEFFKRWLECLINPDYIDNPPTAHPKFHVSLTGRFSSILNAANRFYKKTNISGFGMSSHHVVLRAKEQKQLPPLSNERASYTGSHLCDSTGCLRKEHLELELLSFNLSRKVCPGVMLLVVGDTITDVYPCVHGRTHPKLETDGDELEYACRKNDPRIMQLALIILVLTKGFSSNSGSSEPILDDGIAVYRAQNFYTELLWKYLEARYGHGNAIDIFNKLVMHFISWQTLHKDMAHNFFNVLTPAEVNELLPIMKSLIHIPQKK